MNQAVRQFGERPEELRDLERYRCSVCSLYFEMEHTVAGPRVCPGCGFVYAISPAELAAQLARCAMALNMDPTTLLWTMRIILAGLQSGPR